MMDRLNPQKPVRFLDQLQFKKVFARVLQLGSNLHLNARWRSVVLLRAVEQEISFSAVSANASDFGQESPIRCRAPGVEVRGLRDVPFIFRAEGDHCADICRRHGLHDFEGRSDCLHECPGAGGEPVFANQIVQVDLGVKLPLQCVNNGHRASGARTMDNDFIDVDVGMRNPLP